MIHREHNLAIIIPYRDREEHLSTFLPHMKEFLKNLNNKYSIYIVEQLDENDFNRGKLKNVGFALAKNNHDYFCFHDIDMLPISEACDYSYAQKPTHLAGKVEQFQWKLPIPNYFGGVVLFDQHSFSLINGYYNDFWGWGCEDDDLFDRCMRRKIDIERKSGVYKSLPHTPCGDVIWADGNMHVIHSPECVAKNRAKYRQMTEYDYDNNGLNNLSFQLKDKIILEKDVFLFQVII